MFKAIRGALKMIELIKIEKDKGNTTPIQTGYRVYFKDMKLLKENCKKVESEIKNYNPFIDGIGVNKDMCAAYDKDNIVLGLLVSEIIMKDVTKPLNGVIADFKAYYNNISL